MSKTLHGVGGVIIERARSSRKTSVRSMTAMWTFPAAPHNVPAPLRSRWRTRCHAAHMFPHVETACALWEHIPLVGSGFSHLDLDMAGSENRQTRMQQRCPAIEMFWNITGSCFHDLDDTICQRCVAETCREKVLAVSPQLFLRQCA